MASEDANANTIDVEDSLDKKVSFSKVQPLLEFRICMWVIFSYLWLYYPLLLAGEPGCNQPK